MYPCTITFYVNLRIVNFIALILRNVEGCFNYARCRSGSSLRICNKIGGDRKARYIEVQHYVPMHYHFLCKFAYCSSHSSNTKERGGLL